MESLRLSKYTQTKITRIVIEIDNGIPYEIKFWYSVQDSNNQELASGKSRIPLHARSFAEVSVCTDNLVRTMQNLVNKAVYPTSEKE